jgi:hypothetical protein
MTTKASSRDVDQGIIVPDLLYSLEAVQRILGWGYYALKNARRDGLVVKYYAGKGWVRGSSLISHIVEHGSTERCPHQRNEKDEDAA